MHHTKTILLVLLAACVLACAGSECESIPAPEDVAAPPASAEMRNSGLYYRVLTEGTGTSPRVVDSVTVHYTGWTTDGKMFDSSVLRGMPATFALSGVIAGWTEGLQLMREGGEYRLWIPESLAYRGQAGRPKGMLVFDVSLIAVHPSE